MAEPQNPNQPIAGEHHWTRAERRHAEDSNRAGPRSLLNSTFGDRWRRRGIDTAQNASPRRSDAQAMQPDAGTAQQTEIQKLRQQVASLTDELARSRQDVDATRSHSRNEIDTYKSLVRERDQQLQRATDEWVREKQALTQSQAAKQGQWDSDAKQLRQALAAREAERDGLNAKLQALTEEHTAYREMKAMLERELAEQERARCAWRAEVASLRQEQAQLTAKNTGLQRQNSDWQSMAARLIASSESANQTQVKLENDLANQSREIANLKIQIASLSKEKTDQTSVINRLAKYGDDLLHGLVGVGRQQQEEKEKLEVQRKTEAAEHERVLREKEQQISSLKRDMEQLRSVDTERIKQLAQVWETITKWAAEKTDLERSRDEHKRHAEALHNLLKAQERDKVQSISNVLARAREESTAVLDSSARTLEIERDRRLAAEATNDELRRELTRIEQAALGQSPDSAPVWTAEQRDNVLIRELAALRKHRDGIESERDLLAKRLLRLMEPGQYLAHATTANYDPVTDPLIELKRREARIKNELAVLQAEKGRRRRARKLDPDQTLDEQAYAAALASRWRLIDRPHTRLPMPPKWRLVGFLLDEESEKYLLAIGEHRITEIGRKVATAEEPGASASDDSGRI